jgi:hypothetical protein
MKREHRPDSERLQRKEDPSASPEHTDEAATGLLQRQATGSLPAADLAALTTPSTVVMTGTTLDGPIARKGEGEVSQGASSLVQRAAADSGSHVDSGVASRFNAATGADVSGVRVHTGPASADAAKSIQAQAYTTGQDVHFGAGMYNPGTPAGDHLIAHELAHTVQQGTWAGMQHKLEVSQPGDAHEVQADRVADAVVTGGRIDGSMLSTGSVSRKIMRNPPAAAAPPAGLNVGPLTAYDKAALLYSIEKGDTTRMLWAASFEPAKALADALSDAKYIKFFDVVKATRPLTTGMRTFLKTIWDGVTSFPDKKNIFEAQFLVTISKTGKAAVPASGSTPAQPAVAATDFTVGELDILYASCISLPPGNVEGNPNWRQLVHTTGAMAQGSFGDPAINMNSPLGTTKSFTKTFRHEVGHAVDARNPKVADLRLNQAGWKEYTVDGWIGALGWGTIDAAVQPKVKAAVVSFLGKGKVWGPTGGTFLSHLTAAVSADELKELQKIMTTNNLLAACVKSEGAYPWHNYQNRLVTSGAAWFINHYYPKYYSLAETTHNAIKGWGATAAAFSDKEWFAEVYADWFENGVGSPPAYAGHPGYVQTFMKNEVEKFNAAAPVPAAGGAGAGAGGASPEAPSLPGDTGAGSNEPRIP